MKSKKVKDIKKVLEEGQLYTIRHHQRKGFPIYIRFVDILTLINELESENDCKDIEICKQEYQIKKFKDRIAELEKENGELLEENEGYHGSYRCAIDKIGELYAERYIKVEQFAKMLKEKLFDLGNIVNENDIDESLKEFIDKGDDN